MKTQKVDMISGSLWKAILRFAFPLALISLIQNLFSSVDMIVLGQMADTGAVASVGATAVIVGLIVNFFFGFSTGAKVVLARYFGERNEERVRKTVSTAMLTSLAFGVLAAILGVWLAEPFLKLTKCPADCFAGALQYMRIYLAASPAIMIYNYGTSVISVSGDSVRPLYYMMISGGLNVVLNFILCWIMPQKVAAVAIASVVSQVVGALLVLQNLARSKDMCRWDLRHPSWSGSSFGRLMANGIPLALNLAMAPLANLQIQSAVNSLGSSVMAGNSASLYIESLENSLSTTPLSAATTAFVGQNIGAKKPRRVRDTILYSLALGVGISLILSTLAMCFSEPLASLFVGSDPAAIEATQIRMSFIVQFYFMCVVNSVVGHAIQAFGYPTFATVANIVGVLLFRFFWMTVIYPTYSGFFSVCLCFLVSWVLTMIGQGIFLLYVYFGKFKKGTLKSM